MHQILLSISKLVLEGAWGPPCSSTLEPLPRAWGTHTTATVSVHQRLERGLFFHRGLVRWTWVMDMNTAGKGII